MLLIYGISDVRRPPQPSLVTADELLVMHRESSSVAVPHNPARRETPIQDFANSKLTPKQSKRRASTLLNDRELPRKIRELTPEEQMKFVDKVDQVCRDHSSFS